MIFFDSDAKTGSHICSTYLDMKAYQCRIIHVIHVAHITATQTARSNLVSVAHLVTVRVNAPHHHQHHRHQMRTKTNLIKNSRAVVRKA